jgi:hypothetical protein
MYLIHLISDLSDYENSISWCRIEPWQQGKQS